MMKHPPPTRLPTAPFCSLTKNIAVAYGIVYYTPYDTASGRPGEYKRWTLKLKIVNGDKDGYRSVGTGKLMISAMCGLEESFPMWCSADHISGYETFCGNVIAMPKSVNVALRFLRRGEGPFVQ